MYINEERCEKCMKLLRGEVHEILKHIKAQKGEKEVFGEGEKLLDNQDLCLMLNVSSRTLQRYRSDGVLPFFKRGQKIHYKASAVREFVDRGKFDYWVKKRFDDEKA